VESLFEPFRRLQEERTTGSRGIGLGLSIVRSIVRAHHGEITAEPRSAGGLTVRVRLPGVVQSEGAPVLAKTVR
jgi:signal transduction histidine kinase